MRMVIFAQLPSLMMPAEFKSPAISRISARNRRGVFLVQLRQSVVAEHSLQVVSP
jgi:hypothetical protein